MRLAKQDFSKLQSKFSHGELASLRVSPSSIHRPTLHKQTIKPFSDFFLSTLSFRFLAEDPDSGRRDYLISRNTFLDVTDLTLASVRASDPRVASVTGNIIQGHTSGAVNITVRPNTMSSWEMSFIIHGELYFDSALRPSVPDIDVKTYLQLNFADVEIRTCDAPPPRIILRL